MYRKVTDDFLADPKGCHASPLLGKTVKIYEYVRRTLGVPMHGQENAIEFAGEKGKLRNTIGGYVSVIYHSIRNGDVSQFSKREIKYVVLILVILQLYHCLIDVAKDVHAASQPPSSRL